MRLPLVTAVLCGFLALSAGAQTKRPMTFADMQAMKRIGDPQISPSGKWVLFSVTSVSLEQNSKTNSLWVVPMDGSAKEHAIIIGASDGRFSPDGKSVLFLLDIANGAVMVAPWNEADGSIGEGHGVRSIGAPADGLVWAPDSRHYLFNAAVYPECESHELPGGLHDQDEISCNEQKTAEDAKNPVHARVFDHLLYRHWDSYVGPKHSHIFYGSIDPKDGPPTDITPASVIGNHEAPTFSLGGPLGYAISPDGKEIAYEVNLDKVPAESTNNDIFTLRVGAEPKTAKKVSTSPGSDDGPAYSPDGKWLAWRSQARNGYESDKFDLVVMDRAHGSVQNLTNKFDDWVDSFVWIEDSQHIWFSSTLKGAEVLYRTNVTGDDLHPMAKGGGEWGDFDTRLVNGRIHVIGSRMWVNHPAEIYNVDALALDDSVVRVSNLPVTAESSSTHVVRLGMPANSSPLLVGQLTHLNDELISTINMSSQEPFWFEGANGTKVEGFIVKPPNFDEHKKYPVKFLIHGGPQGAWGDAWSYRWNPELFAASGYVVVMVNPRGSTGYGQKFLEQVSGDWGGRPYIDLMKGLDYAEQHFSFIDKDRECALGASYGGFMADWVLTHTNRFKCIVTHDGMYNPQSAFGTTEEDWFNEWEFRPLASASPDAVVEQSKPAHPWDFYDKPASEDPFRKWSPMLSIKNAKTPTLVIHGQRDYRLDVSEGLQLFNSLQMLGVPSKMLYFENEGHWVLKPKDSELWYQTVDDWVDQWTHTNKYASEKK